MYALFGLWAAGGTATGLARRWAPEGDALERGLAAAVFLPVVGVVTLRVLGGLGALGAAQIVAVLFLEAALVVWLRPKPRTLRRSPGRLTLAVLPPLLVTGAALVLALVAARCLPVFHWDSLGYHLPFVASALQAGSLAGVPWDKPYLGTYPHAVELWDLGARALLKDDKWLDAAELPLSLGAAVAVAGLARRAGANLSLALGFGGLFLCLPAAFLQLPTAYIDVPAAGFFLLAVYWLLAPPTLRSAVLCGLALGLVLGTKANAPVPVALLGAGLLWRCQRAKHLAWGGLAALLAAALGLESYLTTFAAHGNPMWPIQLNLGPLHLPGLHPLSEVLTSGAASPHLVGPLWSRVLRSWTTLHPMPAYDMRVGGFGPLFLFWALPVGLLMVARLRGLWILAGVAALATADPAIARYTLAFPGLCLALSAGGLSRANVRLQGLGATLAAVLAAVGVWLAIPGLSVGGGGLREMLSLSREEREAQLLPATGAPSWAALRAEIAPGATLATDDSFDLMYLLWRGDLANRVVRTPTALEGDALLAWIDTQHVSVIVGSRSAATGRLAIAHPERLRERFPCGASDPTCAVYDVEP